MIHSIEDCLEIITGLQPHNLKFEIDSSDSTIINSIARQVFRGTALTDRQYNLIKEKLLKYKEQFEIQEVIGFDSALEKLRNPLREIDRSKYIKIVDTSEVYSDMVHESYKQNFKWIKIRFPFSKKDIVKIDEVAFKNRKTYFHPKGSHEHYFMLTELNVYNLLSKFSNTEFIIDDVLMDVYKQCCEIKNNPTHYFSFYKNKKFTNLIQPQKEYIKTNDLSDIQIIDRKDLVGYEIEEDINSGDKILDLILSRNEQDVCIKPSLYNINDLVKTIIDLERFPLIVVLDENKAQDQIYDVYRQFNYVVKPEEQCVLFRQEGKTEFNQFVKDTKLNNWLDKNTKIVYISNNNLPKLLLKEEFKPIAALMFDNPINSFINVYLKNNCDLILNYAEVLSPYRNRMYGRYV